MLEKFKARFARAKNDESLPDADQTLLVQTPFDFGPASEQSENVWRKQVLPFCSLMAKGRRFSFTPEKADEVIRNFKARVFDQVPFVLGHTDNAEMGRGEITDFIKTDSGLDAIIKTDDRGTQMVRNNPRLGVSVRYFDNYSPAAQVEGASASFKNAVQHVAATFMPVMRGMSGWKAVNLSEAMRGSLEMDGESFDLSEDFYVLDLTGSGWEFSEEADEVEEVDEGTGEEVGEEVDENEQAPENREGEEQEEQTDDYESEEDMEASWTKGDKATYKRGGETYTGEFVRLDGDTAIVEVDGEEVKVPASMLKKGGEKSDMSEQVAFDFEERYRASQNRIAELEENARQNTVELRRQRVERELDEYGRAGVPSFAVDLARPLLMDDEASGELSYTELSEDYGATVETSSRGDLVRELLNGYRGTVELGEKGDASLEFDASEDMIRRTEEYAEKNGMTFSEAARYIS